MARLRGDISDWEGNRWRQVRSIQSPGAIEMRLWNENSVPQEKTVRYHEFIEGGVLNVRLSCYFLFILWEFCSGSFRLSQPFHDPSTPFSVMGLITGASSRFFLNRFPGLYPVIFSQPWSYPPCSY